MIIPAFIIFMGVILLLRSARLYLSTTALTKHIHAHGRNRYWVEKIGEEQAIALFRNRFIPVQLTTGLALVFYGSWELMNITP